MNMSCSPTDDGTPQGGVISPILANMALDGMQEMLANHFDLSAKGEVSAFVHNKSKVNLVRYADDFIVTAATKEIAEEAKEPIREFLKTRGLELSEEKTAITHINDGFDMLGWTFRKFNGKLIVKPSKKSIKNFVASLSETILKRGKAWKQEVLIEKLNQQIRGWTNYHQSVCAVKHLPISTMFFMNCCGDGQTPSPSQGKMVGFIELLAQARQSQLGIFYRR